jgi:hypothetical protein
METAEKVSSNQQGGAHKAHDRAPKKERYSDDVGSDAGSHLPGGKADAKGTDRGFAAPRAASPMNPQNTHEEVCNEYTRGVQYGGTTSFPDEP